MFYIHFKVKKINVVHNLNIIDFEWVVVVDSKLYVALTHLGSLVLVGILVILKPLQMLHSINICYVIYGRIHVHICMKLMDQHLCMKITDQPFCEP